MMIGHTLLLLSSAALALGHGRVTQPPARASAWRYGFPTPANYDDDGLNCGGFSTQWSSNGGKCGICGDAYNIPPPRPHELGGTYGLGVIVATYLPGAVIATTTHLTASHMGYWEFKLCPDPTDNSQECFDRHPLELENGDTKYTPNRGSGIYNVNYKLPGGLVCEHCVLQWRYVAGNNWGVCNNGTAGLGCGNQEEFRACSDIAIGISKTLSDEAIDNKIPSPLFFYLQNGYYELNQGYLTGPDPKRPTRPHRPTNTKPSKRQPKPSQFQLKPSQQHPDPSQQQPNPSQRQPKPSQTQTNFFQQFQHFLNPYNQKLNPSQAQSPYSQLQPNQPRQPIPSQQQSNQSQRQQKPSKQPNASQRPNQSQRQSIPSQQLIQSQRQPKPSKQQPNHSQRQTKPSKQVNPSQRHVASHRQTKPSQRHPNAQRQSKQLRHNTKQKTKQKAKSKKRKKAQKENQKTRNQRYNYL